MVYRVFDTRLQRPVAIKILTPEKFRDPEHKRRFLQEARAASALNQTNIVTLYDIASDRSMVPPGSFAGKHPTSEVRIHGRFGSESA